MQKDYARIPSCIDDRGTFEMSRGGLVQDGTECDRASPPHGPERDGIYTCEFHHRGEIRRWMLDSTNMIQVLLSLSPLRRSP